MSVIVLNFMYYILQFFIISVSYYLITGCVLV